jgi:hypothetical protein
MDRVVGKAVLQVVRDRTASPPSAADAVQVDGVAHAAARRGHGARTRQRQCARACSVPIFTPDTRAMLGAATTSSAGSG